MHPLGVPPAGITIPNETPSGVCPLGTPSGDARWVYPSKRDPVGYIPAGGTPSGCYPSKRDPSGHDPVGDPQWGPPVGSTFLNETPAGVHPLGVPPLGAIFPNETPSGIPPSGAPDGGPRRVLHFQTSPQRGTPSGGAPAGVSFGTGPSSIFDITQNNTI